MWFSCCLDIRALIGPSVAEAEADSEAALRNRSEPVGALRAPHMSASVSAKDADAFTEADSEALRFHGSLSLLEAQAHDSLVLLVCPGTESSATIAADGVADGVVSG